MKIKRDRVGGKPGPALREDRTVSDRYESDLRLVTRRSAKLFVRSNIISPQRKRFRIFVFSSDIVAWKEVSPGFDLQNASSTGTLREIVTYMRLSQPRHFLQIWIVGTCSPWVRFDQIV
jgi:hypothetical protein